MTTRLSAIGGVLLAAVGLCAATVSAQNGVTFIGHDKVAQGGTLLTQPNLIIQLNRRTETGMSEVHDKETDTIHVLSGSATFITGGEMMAATLTSPGQHRGTGITGGDAHQLTKGDVIVVPAGTPHWFKIDAEPIEYYVVKVIAP
jgi:mannose-6-phosphate isomerase-like protein (cupin superfamily)